MSLETRQQRLKLTDEKYILNALRKNKAIKSVDGVEQFTLQFDGQSFVFTKGTVISVPRQVGNALRRSSGVIIGDHLTGEIEAALVVVGEYNLGEQLPEDKRKATVCGVCDKDFGSLIKLSRHLANSHKNDRADLYVEEIKGEKQPVNWDIDVDQVKADKKKPAGAAMLAIDESDDEEADGSESRGIDDIDLSGEDELGNEEGTEQVKE